MRYIIEIDSPKGTHGAYLAPIKKGAFLNPDSPYSGGKYAKEMEFLLRKCKAEIVAFDDYKVQSAFGNESTHIKIRIME